MKKQKFEVSSDGFYGAWYPNPTPTQKGIILMLGDSAEDRMVVSGVKWLHRQGCHVLAMSPAEKDYGHHNYPLERFGRAIAFMKKQGCGKIGIVGGSTTGMLALIAASYYSEISLTIAFSPSDFVMEGFYQDGKDGTRERPGENESTVSWQGKPLPYLPYAYRHPEYWLKVREESKTSGNVISSRRLFEESERRHPLKEEEKIKVEKIHGRIVFVGAEDDALWDTCRYIRRMERRLSERPHDCTFLSLIYEHGTHFVFPDSMLKTMLPVGSALFVGIMFKADRKFPKECRTVRMEIDRQIRKEILAW